ncbi:MAG: hypothetical protein Q7T55_16275 [Solirubrobacteraceae bacterium]|nr:hypothetical protein [Solirubrobacteraceae bacterium]
MTGPIPSPATPVAVDVPAITRLTYPGALGIPPVQVSFDAPAGWEPLVLSETATLISEAHGDASIVYARERLGALASLEGVASRLLDDASAEAHEFALVDERVITLGGLPGIRREAMVRHTQAEARQARFLVFALAERGGGAVTDLVAIIVTGDLRRRDELAAITDGIEASLTVDG